jgi:hypothetical protein
MDDGVILNTLERRYTMRRLTLNLQTPYTGIAISKDKTETIMEDGKYLKPLKFLGCSYDGVTFKSHTRNGGIWEAENARERIKLIITKLRYAESLTEEGLSNYKKRYYRWEARQGLIKLINEGWNHLTESNEKPLTVIGDKTKISFKSKNKTEWWNKTLTKVEILKKDSIEARTLEMANQKGMRKVMDSTNAHTMMGAYYLLTQLTEGHKKRNRIERDQKPATSLKKHRSKLAEELVQLSRPQTDLDRRFLINEAQSENPIIDKNSATVHRISAERIREDQTSIERLMTKKVLDESAERFVKDYRGIDPAKREWLETKRILNESRQRFAEKHRGTSPA